MKRFAARASSLVLAALAFSLPASSELARAAQPLVPAATPDDPGPPEPVDESPAGAAPVKAAAPQAEPADAELGPGPPEPSEPASGGEKAPAADQAEARPDWLKPELPAPMLGGGVPAGTSAEEQSVRKGPRQLLELAGIDNSHFLMISDFAPLSVNEHEVLLKLIYRVRKFDLSDLALWTQPKFSWQELAEHPEQRRLEMFLLSGRVRRVTVAHPPAEVAEQFELQRYYLCEMEIGENKLPALVITPDIPDRWPVGVEIDQRASAAGLLFKPGPEVGDARQLIFIAQRMAWHPDRVQEVPPTNFGMTVLGDLGMDVGLLEGLEDRSRIDSKDREPFYQMLWAVEKVGPAQLIRHAQRELAQKTSGWQAEAAQAAQRVAALRQEIATRREQGQSLHDLPEQLKQSRVEQAVLLRKLERAKEGAHSIFPLFNYPSEQRGRLVVLKGNVRRAVKILVGSAGGNTNSDIVERYGIDHYYELEMFTPDSENNPLVLCVRELPEGFPTGEVINEGVQVAGFFFKSWAYYTQKGMVEGKDGELHRHQQLAPLLIGRGPLWIRAAEKSTTSFYGVVAAGAFVLGLIGIWIGVWRFNRADEEFMRRTIAKHYVVEEGVSLDQLGLEAEDEPDFRHLHDDPEPPK